MKKININKLLHDVKNGYFIQIGSHDGISNEEYGLRNKLITEKHTAILIEPIPEFFNQISKNYTNSTSEIFFENIAISNKKEIKNIIVNGQDSSFVRDIVGKKLKVNCDTMESIFKKYNFPKINGLFIDTEGYEFDILTSMFSQNYPQIDFIRYEFFWNSEKEELDKLLYSNSYDVYQDEESYADKIAIHKSINF
jgi:FkbM family methyltransferase